MLDDMRFTDLDRKTWPQYNKCSIISRPEKVKILKDAGMYLV